MCLFLDARSVKIYDFWVIQCVCIVLSGATRSEDSHKPAVRAAINMCGVFCLWVCVFRSRAIILKTPHKPKKASGENFSGNFRGNNYAVNILSRLF